jgi:transcriptional regulator with XRE-family HTH domain
MDEKHEDPSMRKVRVLFDKSGLSLHDLGMRMGYEAENARQSAWQFMKTGDPRISMLRKFAYALGIPLENLTIEKKPSSTKEKRLMMTATTLHFKNPDYRILSQSELDQFKAGLKQLSAIMNANEESRLGRGKGKGFILANTIHPYRDWIEIECPPENPKAIISLCKQFGLAFIADPPPPSKPAKVEMDPI